MRLQTKQILAAVAMLLAIVAAKAQAQVDVPFGPENYSHDFQLFAPVEIDLDNEPYVDDYGYMFNYSKLAWSFSGEHVTVGNPDVIVFAEEIYRQNPDDEGTMPGAYQIQNGLQNVYPNAGFGLGDRYEIGYRDRGNGWMLGVLDGPTQQQSKLYGMGSTPGTSSGNIDPNYDGPVSADQLYAFGFGNVHINFETPAGYLLGFRDYLNWAAGALVGTQGGPLLYVGNYGGVLEGDPDGDDAEITFFRLTDDIDEDGIPGAIFVVTIGPDGLPLITTLTDFDDLHQFNIAFDTVEVRTRTKMDGVEAMWTHELTNRHYQAKHQNNRIEIGAGARFLQLEDYFAFFADGGVLGSATSYTWLDNNIVGPQLRAKWTNQRQRWRTSATSSVLLGYNIQNWSQENGIGRELIPGATNRLLYGQPTYSQHANAMNDFSPVGELRLEAAYYLTQSFALKVGYTGMYVGNIKRAATSVRYYLPDMGYRDSGSQNLISNGVDFGVDFVY